MYSFRRPSVSRIDAYRQRQSVRAVFATNGGIPDPPPIGYHANRGSGQVGVGRDAFAAAREAVLCWRMFPRDWVHVETGGETVRIGQIAAVVARCLGIWTVNCCRVVSVEETDRLFAFIYATTDEHALSGAERFSVEWRADDSVWFSIHAVARPRDLVVWLAYPRLRQLQRRFVREAIRAIEVAAVAGQCRSNVDESCCLELKQRASD